MGLRDWFLFFARDIWRAGSWDVSIPSFGPLERQVFVSKSGQFGATQQWISTLGAAFGDEFNLMWDDQFRLLGGQSYHDHWRLQFDFTRVSHAMIVLMDAHEWTSRGQDIEIEDALGRGMPVAFCRAEPFATPQMNERFEGIRASSMPSSSRCFVRFFDLCTPDADREVRRLARWITDVAIPPLRLPFVFEPAQSEEVRATLWVPGDRRQQPVDWTLYRPRFVFNYGAHFVQLGTRIPYASKPRQFVFPAIPTDVAGEIRASITLPSHGVGHAVLTVGEPQTSYAGADGGLCAADERSNLFLWWDFVVESRRC
jgi:hypothetical protein